MPTKDPKAVRCRVCCRGSDHACVADADSCHPEEAELSENTVGNETSALSGHSNTYNPQACLKQDSRV